MGWYCIITSDKKITEDSLLVILKKAPDSLKLYPNQKTGWPLMATDVSIQDDYNIRIGGSWSISGDKAEPMRAFIKKELKTLGHKVRSTKPT